MKEKYTNTKKIIEVFNHFYGILLTLFVITLIFSEPTSKLLEALGWPYFWPKDFLGQPLTLLANMAFQICGYGAYALPIVLGVLHLNQIQVLRTWMLTPQNRKNNSTFSFSALDYFGAFAGIFSFSGLLSIYLKAWKGKGSGIFLYEMGGEIGAFLRRYEERWGLIFPIKLMLIIIVYLSAGTIVSTLLKNKHVLWSTFDIWEFKILREVWRHWRLIIKKFLLGCLGLAPWQRRLYNEIYDALLPSKGFNLGASVGPSNDVTSQKGSEPPQAPEFHAYQGDHSHHGGEEHCRGDEPFCPSMNCELPPIAIRHYAPIDLDNYFERFVDEKKENEFEKVELPAKPEALIDALKDFKISAEVEKVRLGPLVTRYELKLGRGTKASKLLGINYDLARALAVPSVTIGETVSGTNRLNVDLANPDRQLVRFTALLHEWREQPQNTTLGVVLGVKSDGTPHYTDLASMPHLLVCGMTGSGKSETLHSLILSLLLKQSPQEVRFLFIDPKMVEFSLYEQLPHLLHPIVTDTQHARETFTWCIREMEHRYTLFLKLKVRNLEDYNQHVTQAMQCGEPLRYWDDEQNQELEQEMKFFHPFPRIVVIVDELADLMLTVGKNVEAEIVRLAQKARAVGIHLVLATQRPSVDILTGSLKANIPTRIALTVASKVDSRIILDQVGAETLLGRGDMLFQSTDAHKLLRVHGGKVPDSLIRYVVEAWKERLASGEQSSRVSLNFANISQRCPENSSPAPSEKLQSDPLLNQAKWFVIETGRVSVSALQRHLRIGYNRAARLMDLLESNGVVSTPDRLGKRRLISR